MSRTRFSPERIESLRADEIFVFGSNRQGWHGGGAAAYARQRFGLSGEKESDARDSVMRSLQWMDRLRKSVLMWREFIAYAEAHPELTFLVTEIGCGIAGYTVTQIAPLFSATLDMPNVLLPQRFVEYLRQANE